MDNACFRFQTCRDYDVDAYALGLSSYLLFIIAKQPCNFASLAKKVAQEFQGEFCSTKVMFVAGALKQGGESKPYPPVIAGDQPHFPEKIPTEVWCLEGWVKYRLELDSVLNPGLFLDQRENRARLVQMIQNAIAEKSFQNDDSFLNLFSYTGSFTLAALSAGVKSTVSVDLSQRYLDWERKNIEANFGGLEVQTRRFNDDARDFLRRAEKKEQRFRWIVIDPPTFSRGKNVFRVEDELFAMAEAAQKILIRDRSSAILLSTNDQKWRVGDFRNQAEEFALARQLNCETGTAPFEFGGDYGLKWAWLSNP